ncbi:MAG: carboxypeptidase-like regulatory domain-containing protein [Prevotellaceae bacterium]|nr:carboxypeptidase-like regulatory domain-containing protein [Prevotellaceae bacterium]
MKILDYIKGNKKGKQAHDVEFEAMRDSFLADAIEGLESVKGEHSENISRLQERIMQQSASTRKRSRYLWTSIAAVFLMLVIGSVVFLFEYPREETAFAAGQQLPIEFRMYIPPRPADIAARVEKKWIQQEKTEEIRDSVKLSENALTEEQPAKMEDQEVFAVPDSKLAAIIAESESIFQKSRQETVFSGRAAGVAVSQSNALKIETQLTSRTITGKVSDKYGEPLPGVSVMLKETNRGSLTDVDGRYSIDVADVKNPSLIVSYIGMESVEVKNPATYQDIAMKEIEALLDEVVVVGYGAQRKSNMTGSTSDSGVKPQPVAGKQAYNEYLKENMIKPSADACENKKGRVTLVFHVDSTGTPVNIRIKKALCPDFEKEAIRLIKNGPKWTPGTEEAEVHVRF